MITLGLKNGTTGNASARDKPELVMTTYKGITGAKVMFKFKLQTLTLHLYKSLQ